jgi:hypothetical protein
MKGVQLIIILFVLWSNNIFADCKTDRFGVVYCGRGMCETDKDGNVFCSRYRYGDAVVDKYGSVVCGKGNCIAGIEFNEYICSNVEGGGADTDREGIVKCYGGCEKATEQMCENDKGN